ncbi:SDR family NAD(P)-dependent oxidoreductase [Streptomyces johnsoniae]|uniref:SDR family NAD(P)-dependent oxidoreductase n=1 Tax=Streptomyces johnsoniae TaxID=3075532 RepID=A0ABU2S4D4_9ACTN|nr:SDR family NAD(P)-dependent oxidoreductase [Streptomyces sp. DSM 41886]MDT0443844.1 SDR family NAD(P)-dependent oxidoreductase [Streptomyces sp. DSM 41886]
MNDDIKGSSKVIVITGASDGIGATAARLLNQRVHEVIVVGRSPRKTAAVAAELGVNHFVADFARLDDVRKLAADLDAAYSRIDILANNAGGVFGDPVRTVDGFEKTFQINHLAAFLLTSLLMDKLVASRATVIQTTTLHGGNVRKLDLDDLNSDGNLNPIRAYNAAKLENVLFTKELHRRYHSQGLSSAVFYPGIVRTNFGSETTSRLMKFLSSSRAVSATVGTPPEKGADQLVWLAESEPGRDWASGEFYVKRKTGARLNRLAHDADLARGLWQRSEQLIN